MTLISKIADYLAKILAPEQDSNKPDHRVAIVSLLCEVSNANHDISQQEDQAIETTLGKLLALPIAQVKELIVIGKQEMQQSNSLFDFTSQLSTLDHASRINVIEAMWQVAYADLHLDAIEEAIIRKAAGLIYVDHSEFIRTKLKVKNALGLA